MIHQKYSDNNKEKESKKNFQGKSARSIRWFDLDHEWLEENSGHVKWIFYKTLSKTYQVS